MSSGLPSSRSVLFGISGTLVFSHARHVLFVDGEDEVVAGRREEQPGGPPVARRVPQELVRGVRLALVGAALAGLESAQTEWVAEGNERPLGELVDEAMNAVAPLEA